MKGKFFVISVVFLTLISCHQDSEIHEEVNTEITLKYPKDFPSFNANFYENKPTKYGVLLGKKLFKDKRLSVNNSISCASCHIQSKAFADNNKGAIGVFGRNGLRNVPPLQNLAFKKFYMWDGNHTSLENQVLVPIITPEEMGSNILQVIDKIKIDTSYKDLFKKVFGDEKITGDRIYKSIEQFEYTLISANSKYDKVKNGTATFTEEEEKGYKIFKGKCISCHSSEIFTDETFRNIGFPTNHLDEGRARVTADKSDFMAFKVPSLRNVEYTAPYGSLGQFPTLKSVLDYFDNGVIISDNLDPIFKKNNGKIPLTETEKHNLIAFLETLSDESFVNDKRFSLSK